MTIRSPTRSSPIRPTAPSSDAGGSLVYTPAAGFTGPDSFNYKAADDHSSESATTTLFLNVVTPEPPTCTPSPAATVRPNGFRFFFFNCQDAVDSPLTYVIDTPPARGTLSGDGDGRSFTAGSEEGDATFTWHAHSDFGNSAIQTQTITIDASSNTAPSCASPFAVTAKPGVERTFFLFCSDPEGDPLTYTKQSDPAHGTLTDSGGVLRYTASAGYTGPDSFTTAPPTGAAASRRSPPSR